MNIEQRIELAFSKLGLREPFIAAVMTKVKREYNESLPTAGTNGTWVRFNPVWCAQWADEQLFGLVVHESLHVVLMHMWRREGRDMGLWNYANDAIINAYIKARGYKLPDGGVFVDWVRESHSSEEVYHKLKQQQNNAGGEGGAGSGGFDGQGDLHDAQDDATQTDMAVTIAAAAQMAKACGQGSALIDRIIADLGVPSVRWTDEVRSMMTESAASDYTYARCSRRFMAEDLYLPSLHSENMGGLAVGYDTSCSMGDAELRQTSTELHEIIEDLQPAFVEVIYCDSKVTYVQRFERGDLIELKPKGGGGTRFKPVFDHIAASTERYCGLIYFTDMEGDLAECPEPEIPVIWADIGTSHPSAPFGTRVKVSM